MQQALRVGRLTRHRIPSARNEVVGIRPAPAPLRSYAVGRAQAPEEDTMADSEMHLRGSAVRRQLQGDAWVERASRTTYADPVMRTFIDVVTETVFGALWTRPGLDLKTRTLICVISDAATGHDAELEIHLRMALRQGWTEDELTEALLQLLGYVGAPSTRGALLVASRVFAAVRSERA
jgi:4-carboxymuconolactone decarboxylase